MKKVVKMVVLTTMLIGITFTLFGCIFGNKVDDKRGITDKTITVATTAATSGPFAFVGTPFKAGMDAVFKQTNEKGGIHGRKIVFLHESDEGDPVKGAQIVQKFLNKDKVFGIVGSFAATTEPSVPLVQKANAILFYAANGTKALYIPEAKGAEKGIMAVQPISINDGRAMLASAVTKKLYGAAGDEALPKEAKIGVLHTSLAGEKEMLEGIQLEARTRGYSNLVIKEVNTKDATAVNAAVTFMKNENVSVLIIAMTQPTFKTTITPLINADFTAPVFTSYFNADASVFGDATPKFRVFANTWIDLTDESGQQDLNTYLQFLIDTNSGAYATNAFFSAGYIAGKMFVEALERTGKDLTVSEFIKAQEKAGKVNIPMGGTVDFANGKRIGTEDFGLVEFLDKTKSGKVDANGQPIAAYVKARDLTGITEIK